MQPNADAGTGQATRQEDGAHLEIDIAQPEMGRDSRGRGSHNCIGVRSRGYRGRHANHHEDGRHQKTASNAEQSREQPDDPADANECPDMDAYSRNWQQDSH